MGLLAHLASPSERIEPNPSPRRTHQASARILVPVRYAAWLNGDIGLALERTFATVLAPRLGARVTRTQRGLLVESPEAPGPLLEAVRAACLELDACVQEAYPVLHHEMGPVWTGTLQAVFD